MFYQTIDCFNDNIRESGCNFFSCLAISELESKKKFLKQDIEPIYNSCIRYKYMTQNCVVLSPDEVIDFGLRYLSGREIKVYQIGSITDGRLKFWGWVKNKKYKYMIYRWRTFKGGEHFNLYDSKGNKLYDSWPEDVENELIQKLLYQIGR